MMVVAVVTPAHIFKQHERKLYDGSEESVSADQDECPYEE